MESQKDDFTLKNYGRCLEHAQKKGYAFATISDYFKKDFSLDRKSIILRHDIDTQLDVALEMGKMENQRNIRATYFIRLHSHAYNPLCVKDLRKILLIKNMGHEIGLHYESDFYHIIGKDIKEGLLKEVEIINFVTGEKIESVCPHEPTRTNQFHIKGISLNQAYDSSLMRDFKYISDSSCRWRDGTFYENIQADHQRLYVLTHPYWWYNQTPIENY